MGYSYRFRLTVDDPKAFKQHKQAAIALHTRLKSRTWFPAFGSSGHGGGYGCGENEHLRPELTLFTSAFPDFTFKLWMSYWDNTNLRIIEIRNNMIISEHHVDYEVIKIFPGCEVTIELTPDSMYLEHEISNWFTD